VTTFTWRASLTLLAGGMLAAAGLTLTLAGPAVAATAKGDNGTVKIHRSTTPVTDRRNQPHVCVFYLDGFGFDAGQSVSWQIKSWPPTGDRAVVSSGTLVLNSNGGGATADMTLPNGHYKLLWNFTGERGFAKQKVFWVACRRPLPSPGPSPSGSPAPSGSATPSRSPAPSPAATPSPRSAGGPSPAASPPGGGRPTTGQPLALIAGAGASLLGTGGATLAVARRRRRGLHGR
jgi:hypothetical protein